MNIGFINFIIDSLLFFSCCINTFFFNFIKFFVFVRYFFLGFFSLLRYGIIRTKKEFVHLIIPILTHPNAMSSILRNYKFRISTTYQLRRQNSSPQIKLSRNDAETFFLRKKLIRRIKLTGKEYKLPVHVEILANRDSLQKERTKQQNVIIQVIRSGVKKKLFFFLLFKRVRKFQNSFVNDPSLVRYNVTISRNNVVKKLRKKPHFQYFIQITTNNKYRSELKKSTGSPTLIIFFLCRIVFRG